VARFEDSIYFLLTAALRSRNRKKFCCGSGSSYVDLY
jgi:hypothetical protein